MRRYLLVLLILLFPGIAKADMVSDANGHQIYREDHRQGNYIFRTEIDLTKQQQPIMAHDSIGPILSYSPDGKSWFAVKVNVSSYAVSPNFANDKTIYVNADNKILVSKDAGRNFYPVEGLPREARAVFSPDYANDSTVYAYNSYTGGTFFISKDSGQHWASINQYQFSPSLKKVPYTIVDVVTKTNGVVYLLAVDSIANSNPNCYVYVSNDYGNSFSPYLDNTISANEIFKNLKG